MLYRVSEWKPGLCEKTWYMQNESLLGQVDYSFEVPLSNKQPIQQLRETFPSLFVFDQWS